MSLSTQTPSGLRPDAWLSKLLGLDCHHISVDGLDPDEAVFREFLSAPARPRRFIDAKVSTSAVATAQRLESLGFRIVDTCLGFDKPLLKSTTEISGVRFARDDERAAIERIAADCVVYSRFHLDPSIDPAAAARVKAQWAGNFFVGKRGDHMVVAESEGSATGFLQLIAGAEKTLIIDLIAVTPPVRGRGLASAMIRFAERELAGFERVFVGTQASNAPSVRLYEKLGFCLCESQYVLHFHGPESLS